MKRVFAVILAMALLIGVMPMQTLAADTVTVVMEGDCGAQGGNAHYTLTYSDPKRPDIMTLTVSGQGDMKNFETCDEIEKRTPWYNKYEENIWHVVIGDGITSVGDNTCLRCSNLLDVELPDSVTVIGEEAFSGCRSLVEINIPQHLTSIGSGAFRECPLYDDIVFPETLQSIGSFAFSMSSQPRHITFPKTLTEFGENCFIGTAWMNSQRGCVVVNGVMLGYTMLYPKENNADVTIPDTVTTIVPGALFSNSELKTVTVPETVTEIGDHAFGYPRTEASKKLTVRGRAGSAAEAHAKEYGFTFEELPDSTPTPQPTATPTPEPTATPAPQSQPYRPGDVTGDGKITSADALQIQRYVVKRSSVLDNAEQKVLDAADVTGEGDITSADALQIQRYVVQRPSVLDGR